MKDIISFTKVGSVLILDQTKLPFVELYVEAKNYSQIIKLIKKLSIRGAPAIGVAGAFACFLAAKDLFEKNSQNFIGTLSKRLDEIKLSRPTAVNLEWAVKRFSYILETNKEKNIGFVKTLFFKEARKIFSEEKKVSESISKVGSKLFKDNFKVLTHCNTGSLATTGPGTALGVIKHANKRIKKLKVYATETRPLLQGSRLTLWECNKSNIDCTLITDSMASHVIKLENIDMVIVGADRIAANGDVANKIGTYQLAVTCSFHKVPFYVAAPFSTFDLSIKSGKEINIEERDKKELLSIGTKIVAKAKKVFNPAFDITPCNLISGIVTEKGIIKKPDKAKILKF